MNEPELKSLDKTDVEFIKRKHRVNFIIVSAFLVVSIVVFSFFFHVVETWIVYVFFDLPLIALLIFIYKRAQRDIETGNKYVFNESITDKRTSHYKNSTSYYLVVGSKKFMVSYKDYYRFEMGDRVEIHYTVKTETIISIKHQNENGDTAIDV